MFGSHYLILRSLFIIFISSVVISELRVHSRSSRKQYSANSSRIPVNHSENNQMEETWNGNKEITTSVVNFPAKYKPTSNKTVKSRKRRNKEDYASYASQIFAKYNPLCDRRARAVVLYAGSALMLDCDLCGYVKTGAMWTKLPLGAYGQEQSELFQETIIPEQEHRPDADPSTPFYMDDLALGVQRVSLYNEGIYQCKTEAMMTGNELIRSLPLSYYYVEVKKTLQSIKEINLDVGERPRIDGPAGGSKPHIFVYTSWSLWGQCSGCDLPGIRKRVGYCYALVEEDSFAGGVPCGSTLVPPAKVSDLTTYLDQQLVVPCRTPCTDQASSSPFDSNSSPLHVAGSHFYNKRIDNIQTIRVQEGSHARLVCPEAYHQDVVWWRKGTHKLLIPIERPTASLEDHSSRLFMDPDGSLIFTELTMNDSEIYRCDVNDRMTANYRVYVLEQILDMEAAKRAFSALTVIVVAYISLFVLAMFLRYYMRLKVQEAIERMQAEARLDLEADLEDDLPDD